MTDDAAVRRVAVGLIRSLNASLIDERDTDDELVARYGKGAEPLARALVETIREEVRRID